MIELNKVYYYNNRQVIPLIQEYSGIYKCYINYNIDHDVTGSNFCIECMAGHGYSSHKCDIAQDVIDAVMENISDADIIFIPEVYLRDYPVEYKEYVKLKKQNNELNTLNSELIESNNLLKDSIQISGNNVLELEKQKENLLSEIKELENAYTRLKNNKNELNKDIDNLNKKIEVDYTNISISFDEFKELAINSMKYVDLRNGGVDNWEWYYNSIEDNEFYKKLFVNTYL